MRRTRELALPVLRFIGRGIALSARAGGALIYPRLFLLPRPVGELQTRAGDRR